MHSYGFFIQRTCFNLLLVLMLAVPVIARRGVLGTKARNSANLEKYSLNAGVLPFLKPLKKCFEN